MTTTTMKSTTEMGYAPPSELCRVYSLEEKIGEGGFSQVYEARHTEDGDKAALKIFKYTFKAINHFEKEVKALEKLRSSPTVINLKAFSKKENLNGEKVSILVLDFHENGDLHSYLEAGKFSDEVARTYLMELVSTLIEIHQNFVFHRDLKPENIVLDENFHLVLADFGASLVAENEDLAKRATEVVGSPQYSAPEVLQEIAYDASKADIWSLGVILFNMLAGWAPVTQATDGDWWYDKLKKNNYEKFWKGHNGHNISSEAKSLIESMLCVNPDARATLEIIVEHPWLKNGSRVSDDMLKSYMNIRKEMTNPR